MKKWKLILLSVLSVASTTVGYYYFYEGFWFGNYKIDGILGWFLDPLLFLAFATTISLIMMLKDKRFILPILLVIFGIALKHFLAIKVAIDTSFGGNITFPPLLILFDFIFKTAAIIVPAFIIYGIFCSVKARKVKKWITKLQSHKAKILRKKG